MGDVSVLRSGLVYESRNLLNWGKSFSKKSLNTFIYGFFARYGAVNQGGSDRTNLGTTGNFSDNDYSALFGNRWNFVYPSINVFFDITYSTGIDRKLPSATEQKQDIDNDGFATNLGLKFNIKNLIKFVAFKIVLDFFYATGSKFNDNGIQTTHGFVSFKGSQIGGLLMNRYWGAHPSTYTDDDGIDDWAHDYDRKSGTAFGHISLSTIFFYKLRLRFDYWYLFDTSQSSVKIADTIPKKSQLRLGKEFGMEFNFSLDFIFNRFWSVYLKTGIFKPGNFFNMPGIKQESPFGSDNFWGFLIGSRLII